MSLKAIGFDLWETLITDSPDRSGQTKRLRLARIERILAQRGFGAEAARIEEAYGQVWQRCHELYWSSDVDISSRRQVEHFLEELRLECHRLGEEAVAEIEHAYANAAVELLPELVAGADAVLGALKKRGLALGLISNTGRTPGYALRAILDRLGVARYIDAMVFSNEHGLCKPQASIFEELRAGLGVDCSEMLFVGDNLYADIYGAQRCGMRAIHFLPRKRGVAVSPLTALPGPVVPDATITHLEELLAVLDELAA